MLNFTLPIVHLIFQVKSLALWAVVILPILDLQDKENLMLISQTATMSKSWQIGLTTVGMIVFALTSPKS